MSMLSEELKRLDLVATDLQIENRFENREEGSPDAAKLLASNKSNLDAIFRTNKVKCNYFMRNLKK